MVNGPEPPNGFALRRSPVAIELHPDGLGHPRSVRFGGAVFTRYEDVTHLLVGAGGLRLGTLRGSFLFRSGDFATSGAHRALADALRERIAALPDGAERLGRMRELDALAASRRGAPVVLALTVACVLAYLLQVRAPMYTQAGAFAAFEVYAGETWRLVTFNFLHGSPGHLLMNLLGLVVLGGLVERSIGSRAAAAVITLAGLGAMIGCALAGYPQALGASGIVAGLAAALLWLELKAPMRVPVSWRIPRRLFVAILALEALVLLRVPDVAHAAHAGGFAAGMLGAAMLSPGRTGLASQRGLRVLNALSLLLVLLAGTAWIRSVDPEVIARRGETLLTEPTVSPGYLNNEAWRIAISESPSRGALDVALRMAQRAARDTDWSAPVILDTLAELYFLTGDAPKALEIGREAVALAPGDDYYREQVRRFAGERAAADRPEQRAPSEQDPPARRRRPESPEERVPGIRV